MIDIEKLNVIRNNYPDTWKWIQHKASWEGMCLSEVLHTYVTYIDDLMHKEGVDRKEVECRDCKYWWSPDENDAHYCANSHGLQGLVAE